jgi:hypothetical protein
MTFIDTLGVPEFFAEALTRVERVGPNRRLVFTVTQPDESGGLDPAAVVKLVVAGGVVGNRSLRGHHAAKRQPEAAGVRFQTHLGRELIGGSEQLENRRAFVCAMHHHFLPYQRLIWNKAST